MRTYHGMVLTPQHWGLSTSWGVLPWNAKPCHVLSVKLILGILNRSLFGPAMPPLVLSQGLALVVLISQDPQGSRQLRAALGLLSRPLSLGASPSGGQCALVSPLPHRSGACPCRERPVESS